MRARGGRWRSWSAMLSLRPPWLFHSACWFPEGHQSHLPSPAVLPCPCPAQFSTGSPAGGDVPRGLVPPSGNGCPSSVASGSQSVAATASASPAGGLGDSGVFRLWRRAGCGGSGGGTEGARLGAPAIRRGRALGLAVCSGATGAGAMLRGWATGGGGIMGRAGAGRLPGKKAAMGWGPLCQGLSLG